MSRQKFDVYVIGAGPGGYVAAIRAGRLGAKVAIVENDFLGGTCLNYGCIPTKTLIASAERFHEVKTAHYFGVKINGEINFDWRNVLARKITVVEKLRSGIEGLLKNSSVSIFSFVNS